MSFSHLNDRTFSDPLGTPEKFFLNLIHCESLGVFWNKDVLYRNQRRVQLYFI